MRKRVFISHPYAEKNKENIRRINIILERLKEEYKDILFISPLHLFSYFKEEDRDYREDIMNFCFDSISLCDELWILGVSEGCIEEAEWAIKEGLNVYVMYDLYEMEKVKNKEYLIGIRENGGIYTYRDIEGVINECC